MSAKTIQLFQSRSPAARELELSATRRHLELKIRTKRELATALLNEVQELQVELDKLKETT